MRGALNRGHLSIPMTHGARVLLLPLAAAGLPGRPARLPRKFVVSANLRNTWSFCSGTWQSPQISASLRKTSKSACAETYGCLGNFASREFCICSSTFMCVYIYIYICVCIHIHIHIHIHISYICIHLSICANSADVLRRFAETGILAV